MYLLEFIWPTIQNLANPRKNLLKVDAAIGKIPERVACLVNCQTIAKDAVPTDADILGADLYFES